MISFMRNSFVAIELVNEEIFPKIVIFLTIGSSNFLNN